MKRVLWLALTTLIAVAVFYLSRFWTLRLWDRGGLFGIEELRPQGNLIAQWLRGTPFQPFELLIWILAVFLLLTVVQKLYDAL